MPDTSCSYQAKFRKYHKILKETLCHLFTVLNCSNNIYPSLFAEAIQGTALPNRIDSSAVLHTWDFSSQHHVRKERVPNKFKVLQSVLKLKCYLENKISQDIMARLH